MSQLGVPTDMQELMAYVDETYDIDTARFTPKENAAPETMAPMPTPGAPLPQPGGGNTAVAPPKPAAGPQTLKQLNELA